MDADSHASGGLAFAQANCPPDHPYVLGGGGQTNGVGALLVTVPVTGTPSGTGAEQPQSGWFVQSSVSTQAGGAVTAFAICGK